MATAEAHRLASETSCNTLWRTSAIKEMYSHYIPPCEGMKASDGSCMGREKRQNQMIEMCSNCLS